MYETGLKRYVAKDHHELLILLPLLPGYWGWKPELQVEQASTLPMNDILNISIFGS